MPMLDAYIPEGALEPAAEAELMSTLTDTLLRFEGADPADPRARSIGWVFLHRPAAVYVAGEPTGGAQPRYRIVASVPEAGAAHAKRRLAIAKAEREAVFQ